MNKNDFKFLLQLSNYIDQGCKILVTNRNGLLQHLQVVLEAASFGMEMGVALPETTAKKILVVEGKDVNRSNRSNQLEIEIKKLLTKNGEMRLAEITESVKPLLSGLSNQDKCVWIVLSHDCFEKVPDKRGFYRLKDTKKPGKKPGKKPKSNSKTKVKTRSKTIVDEAQKILKKNGDMRISDIASALGHLVSDLSDPIQAVWKAMKKSPLFESVPEKTGFYRLVKGK